MNRKQNKASDKLIEEMAELTFALLKYRKRKNPTRLQNIKDEIEDVKQSLKILETLI